MSGDVARQSVYQSARDVERVGVQRSDELMVGFGDCRTPASASDHVTLPTERDHCPAAGYLRPARHEFTTPRRARPHVALVVVPHQTVEIGVSDLRIKLRARC